MRRGGGCCIKRETEKNGAKKQNAVSVVVLFLPPLLSRSNLTVISTCRGRRNSALNEWVVSRAAFCTVPLMELGINYCLKHKQHFSL